MDGAGAREGLDRLAGRVMGPRGATGPTRLPSPDLCTTAMRLAAALAAYERDGGTAHRDDVLALDAFSDVVVLARCKTALPRPQGRWEIALTDGAADEWVIGEAGGSWTVEGLERLSGGTAPHHQVGVDDAGSTAPPPAPRRRMRRRATVGWFPDPEARHDFRYCDGTTWTRFVIDGAGEDPGS